MKKLLRAIGGLAAMLPLLLSGVFPQPAAAAPLDFLEIKYEQPSGTYPLDRYLQHKLTVKNTSTAAQEIGFKIYVQDTKQDVVGWPQGQTLYLDPGETETAQTFLDEMWGKLERDKAGDYTRTVLWTFEDTKTRVKRTETITYKWKVVDEKEITGDMKVQGKVIGVDGKPAANAQVSLSTGNWTKNTTAGSDGTFTFPGVPERTDWIIKASAAAGGGTSGQAGNPGQPAAGGQPGQPPQGQAQPPNGGPQPGANCLPPPNPCNPPAGVPNAGSGGTAAPQVNAATTTDSNADDGVAFAYVKKGTTDYTLTLQPPTHTGSYTATKHEKTTIGFWKGDVDDKEQFVLAVNGMENWNNPSLKAQSKLYLYTLDGELKWAYDMGWEAWGADLSADGKLAAFATSNSTRNLGVIDTATGKPVWVKSAKDFIAGKKINQAGEGGGIDSKEIAISNTNKYVGVGHGGGDAFLAEAATGKVLWSAFLKGQIRGITFDREDKFMFVGSGDGRAYKLKIEDGSVVWSAGIGSWPFTGGFKLSKDGKYLGTAGKYGEVAVIDAETGKQLWINDQKGNASWLDFSPDGKYVFAGGGGQGASTLYETATGKQLWRLNEFSHQGRFSADGKYILTGNSDVKIVDLHGNLVTTIRPSETEQNMQQGQFAYISNDGSKVIFTRRDMDKEGNGIIFAKGSLTLLERAIAKSSDEAAAAESAANKLPLPILAGAGIGALGLIAVIGALLMKRRRTRKLRAATPLPAAHKPHFLDDAHELDIHTGEKPEDAAAKPDKPESKPPRKIQL